MKVKLIAVFLIVFIAGLAFAQKDPNVYSIDPDIKWTFVNASSYSIIILFKNNVGFGLGSNGDTRSFTPTWLVDNTGNLAEDEVPSVGYVSMTFPNGRKYWSYRFFVLNGGKVKYIAKGSVITYIDDDQ